MSNKQVEVNIAGQPYRFAISADNEAALLEAVALVDDKMNKLKGLSLIHISEPTRHFKRSRMPSSA